MRSTGGPVRRPDRSATGTSRTAAWRRSRRRSRAAARSVGSRHAVPPTSKAAGSPERSAVRDRATDIVVDGRAAIAVVLGAGRLAAVAPRDVGRQDRASRPVRAGRTRPRRASAASLPTSPVLADQRMKLDTLRATVSMSDSSCASYCLWYVAWSPTMLTTGVWPLRALCRLARPLPRPGPRCSSVAAGRSAMRPYPSAAPVATPFEERRARCASREPSSSAATKCISDVPGFMKQVSTPHADQRADQGLGAVHRLSGLVHVEDRARVEDAVRDRRRP